MNHDNMNDLLALYFHEGHNRQIKETAEHVKQCSICQNYLSDIERIDQKFNLLRDEVPPQQSIQLILNRISKKEQPRARHRFFISARRLVPFGFAVLGSVLFFMLIRWTMTVSIFSFIHDWWLIRSIGEFGASALILWLIGFMVCVVITPVLILEYQSQLSKTSHTWKYIYSK